MKIIVSSAFELGCFLGFPRPGWFLRPRTMTCSAMRSEKTLLDLLTNRLFHLAFVHLPARVTVAFPSLLLFLLSFVVAVGVSGRCCRWAMNIRVLLFIKRTGSLPPFLWPHPASREQSVTAGRGTPGAMFSQPFAPWNMLGSSPCEDLCRDVESRLTPSSRERFLTSCPALNVITCGSGWHAPPAGPSSAPATPGEPWGGGDLWAQSGT